MKSICLRGEIHLLSCLLTSYQLRNFYVSLLKSVLSWLLWKVIYLMWYLLLQFFLEFSSIIPFMWYDFKILVKSKGRGTSLCLSSSVNWHKYFFFFHLKAKYPIFIFLVWMEQFWIWFSWKLTKNAEIFIVLESSPYLTTQYDFEYWFRSIN